MEPIDFNKWLIQAEKIEDGLKNLSEKLQNPYSIGYGKDANNRLIELEQKVSAHEEILKNMQSSIKTKLSNLKQRNQQRKEFITNLKSEIKKIEDKGKELGFVIPTDEFGKVVRDDKSPAGSPCALPYQATPTSTHSLNHISEGPL